MRVCVDQMSDRKNRGWLFSIALLLSNNFCLTAMDLVFSPVSATSAQKVYSALAGRSR